MSFIYRRMSVGVRESPDSCAFHVHSSMNYINRWLTTRWLLLGFIILFVGCAPTTDVAIIGPTFPAWQGDVRVFTTRADVPSGAVEIARIIVLQGSGQTGSVQQAMLDVAKIQAAEVGGNAILLDGDQRRYLSYQGSMSSALELVVIALRVP